AATLLVQGEVQEQDDRHRGHKRRKPVRHDDPIVAQIARFAHGYALNGIGFVFAVEPIEGHVRFSLWVLAVGLGIGVSAAGAAGAGSIVVRLQTDPAPARVAWSYSGVGQAFKLRASGSSRTISGLADGTYRL